MIKPGTNPKVETFLENPDAAPRKKHDTIKAYVCPFHTDILAVPYENTDKTGKKTMGLACRKCRLNFTPGVTEINRFLPVEVKEFI